MMAADTSAIIAILNNERAVALASHTLTPGRCPSPALPPAPVLS